MSHPLLVGDILKLTIVVEGLDGQVALPGCHYRAGISTGAGTLDTNMASELDTLLTTALPPCLANTAIYVGCLVQKIFPLPVTRRVGPLTTAIPGTGGANPAPLQACPIISLKTPLAGPSQRGRIYLPFMPSGVLSTVNGKLSNIYHNVIQNLANALLGYVTVGTAPDTTAVDLVLYHRNINSYDVVINADAQFNVATQKKRGNYGKKNLLPSA